jgi:hypothetical protein
VLIGNRYEKVEGSTRAGIDVPLPRSWTAEDVESWLMVHAAAANAGKTVDYHTDLFAQGFDRWVEDKSGSCSADLNFLVSLRHS